MSIFSKKYRLLHIVIVVFIILAAFKAVQIYQAIQASAGKGAPPTTVNTVIVTEADWPKSYNAIGTLKAKNGSILSFEDSGRVSKIHFEAGETVKAGDVLIELDSEVEQAQLQAAYASLKLAKLTAERQGKLRKNNANSQADLDLSTADLSLAQAEAIRLQSTIKRRQIVSPFDGIIGVKKVNIGEFVNAGVEAVDVNSFDEFYLDFYLPQAALGNFKMGDAITIKLGENDNKKLKGELTGINSQIDPVNRNILLQASIKNKDDLLRPGMFVEVELTNSESKLVKVVPVNSIRYAPYGNTAYSLVKDSATPPFDVQAETVELGRTKGDLIEVTKGLKIGQEIIASGTFKLFPGIKVFINNDIAAPVLENPQVKNN